MPHFSTIITAILLVLTVQTKAQTGKEYTMEIGAGVGVTNYLGDFNGSVTKGFQPAAALVYRYAMNPRQQVRVDLGLGKMKGTSAKGATVYPDFVNDTPAVAQTYVFSNTLIDLNVSYEYNFWPYGTGREYRGAKPLTPYVSIGLGGTMTSGKGSTFTANVPIGLGMKYKMAERLNLSLQWTLHATFSDKLDGVKDPYRIPSSGIFKNTDFYSGVMIALTYSFKEKCRTCHNDSE